MDRLWQDIRVSLRGLGKDRAFTLTTVATQISDARESRDALVARLGEAGVGIYTMLPDAPTLEELFFGLTEGLDA